MFVFPSIVLVLRKGSSRYGRGLFFHFRQLFLDERLLFLCLFQSPSSLCFFRLSLIELVDGFLQRFAERIDDFFHDALSHII